MALEDKIEKLTASVDALTAQLKGGAAPAAAAGKTAAGKGAAGKGPKNSADVVAQRASTVKADISKEAAVFLIQKFGKTDKLANMKPENYDAFVAAADAAIEAGEVEGMDSGADDDM